MHRGLKITAWSAAVLVALIVLLVGTVLIVGNTESGRAFIVRVTAQLTKGHVKIAGIHGSFPAALDLDRLELSDDDGVWLFAEHISLRWSPGALLTRHVKVDTLRVARLHIERAPLPDKEKKPSSTPSVPHTDVANLSVDTLELGKALAGEAVSLSVKADAQLRSLQNATAHVVAQRTGGNGNYELQVQFDPVRMDATLKVQEPANGPLENLIKVPGLGELSLSARLSGPRTAAEIELTVDAGPLRGRALGTIDLVHSSADLDYSLNAPRMTPYPGLTWQSVDLKGRFHGPFTQPKADGHLLIKELQAPGGTQLSVLDADLTANAGLMTLHADVDGLLIPGPQPTLFQDSRLQLNAAVQLDDAKRPVEIRATHRLFTLKANALTAGEQSAQLDLRLPDVAPFAAIGGQQVRGDAEIKAQVKHDATSTSLTAGVSGNIDGGTAVWAGTVRGGPARLQLAAELTDRKISIERLQLTGRAISLLVKGTAARTDAQELDGRVDLSLPDLASLSPAVAGTLNLSGKVKGPSTSLSVATELTSTLSIHGSPPGTVSATIQAGGLPKSPRGILEAHGDLDGAPLQLDVVLQRGEANVVHAMIRRADWKSAHAEGNVTLRAGDRAPQGRVTVRVARLDDLRPWIGQLVQGSVSANVDFAQAAGRAQAKIEIDARNAGAHGFSRR